MQSKDQSSRLSTVEESTSGAAEASDVAYPASFAQQRLWFFDQYDSGAAAYSHSVLLRVVGTLDPRIIERALNEIVGRHEVLRTRFALQEWQLVQSVSKTSRLHVSCTDLSAETDSARESLALDQARAVSAQPFDLSRRELLRAHLWRLSGTLHFLLLDAHQIVADNQSVDVLMRELGALYEAFALGHPSPLAELPLQYADFVLWQRERMQGNALEEHLSFWKTTLAGAPPVLALRTDRPRPARQTYAKAHEEMHFRVALVDQISALSIRQGVTPFMVILAAVFTVLYRHTGQTDLVVGSHIANRPRLKFQPLIGLFKNMLALRVDLAGNPTFRELLTRVFRGCTDAFSHQEMPFERLLEELQPHRDPTRNPVFQTSFEYPRSFVQGFNAGGIQFTPLEETRGSAPMDLSFFAGDRGGRVVAGIDYNPDLFDAATIRRMLGHLHTLVEAVVEHPELTLDAVPLLTSAERHELLVEWNQTASDFPRDACVHDLFEAQVARTPDAIAVRFGDEAPTYRELNTRSNRLAHYLGRLGIGPETRVGICTERCTEMVVGLLAILKAGGAYVPLDPAYPPERVALLLDDAAPPVVLAQKKLAASFSANFSYSGIVLPLDRGALDLSSERDDNPKSGVAPDQMAYLIYTSGSTGRPKGVMVLHRGVVNYLTWCVSAYSVASGRGAPVQSSLSFDLTVTSLFAPLVCGRTVALVREKPAGTGLAELLDESKDWSLVKTTPAELTLLSTLLSPERASGGTRAFVVGGESLSAETLAFWRVHAPETRIFNEYGPTETVVGCSVYEVGDEPLLGAVSIGRPIANTRLYILGPDMQPVPIGVVGELCIAGEGVARGYWRQPKLTAERFVPYSFGAPDARMYRSGDFARYLPNGNIEYLGRRDSQVKLRGYRIELDEIESTLMSHRAVRRCAVLAREDVPGEKRLVAYVEPGSAGAATEAGLRAYLKARLPAHMVPSAVVIQGALPQTPNGKIDRRSLPAPGRVARESDAPRIAPRDSVERRLTEIWEQVLGVTGVGVSDDYFDLGGHSLLAVKLFSRIGDAFGQQLPLATIFEAPTIDLLARRLRQPTADGPWTSLVRLQAGGTRIPLFCLPGIGGNVLGFADLVPHLGADQPVFGLQAQGLDGKTKPLTRVEDMARHYITEITTVLPRGPFLLGGHSLGGIVAYEMARQLDAAGLPVALVALFDASVTGTPPSPPGPEWLKRVRGHIWRMIGRADGDGTQRLPQPLRDVSEAGDLAGKMYVPQPYRGKVTLFRAMTRSSRDARPFDMGWERLALGGLEIREVPGDHDGILQRPHVEALAAELRESIQNALPA